MCYILCNYVLNMSYPSWRWDHVLETGRGLSNTHITPGVAGTIPEFAWRTQENNEYPQSAEQVCLLSHLVVSLGIRSNDVYLSQWYPSKFMYRLQITRTIYWSTESQSHTCESCSCTAHINCYIEWSLRFPRRVWRWLSSEMLGLRRVVW
jgi:hypothetical protein